MEKTLTDGTTVQLPLNITFLKSGLARVVLDEEKRRTSEIELRHESKARKERYHESQDWAIVGGLDVDASAKLAVSNDADVSTIQYGDSLQNTAIIRSVPFGIQFQRNGKTEVQLNNRGFMNLEHWRPKLEDQEGQPPHYEGEDQSTWWEESFGGNTDTKPRGPESIAMDITFPGYEHVFGIPEHTGPLSLRETR